MAKKYKGTAKIELTNTKTGEKTVQIENNMVTNALLDLVTNNPYGAASFLPPADSAQKVPKSKPFPEKLFYTHIGNIPLMMSGILLFDTTLEENPFDYKVPKAPLAYAGNTTNSLLTDKKRGSFLNGSKLTNNGFQFSWEWGTEQGNGTYSSIALTNPFVCNGSAYGDTKKNDENTLIFPKVCCELDGCYRGLDRMSTDSGGYASYSGFQYLGNFTKYGSSDEYRKEIAPTGSASKLCPPHHIDVENGYWYRLETDPSGKNLTLVKGKRGTFKIPTGQVNSTNTEENTLNGLFSKEVTEKQIVLQNSIFFDLPTASARNVIASVSTVGNTMYIFSVKDNTNQVLITKIDLLTNSATQETKTFPGATFYIEVDRVKIEQPTLVLPNESYCLRKDVLLFKNNYLYIPNQKAKNGLIKVNITNPSDIKEINNDFATQNLIIRNTVFDFGNFVYIPYTAKLGKFPFHSNYIEDVIISSMVLDVAKDSFVLSEEHSEIAPSLYNDINYYFSYTNCFYNSCFYNYNLGPLYMLITTRRGYAYLAYNPFYLATINNVQTFTKTPDDLMKITYTITEVE